MQETLASVSNNIKFCLHYLISVNTYILEAIQVNESLLCYPLTSCPLLTAEFKILPYESFFFQFFRKPLCIDPTLLLNSNFSRKSKHVLRCQLAESLSCSSGVL